MKLEDFVPFFGVEVLLQLKEPIALAVVTGTGRKVPRFTSDGKPAGVSGEEAKEGEPMAAQPTWPIGAQRDPEGKTMFSYLIEGAVLLTQKGRLVVTYRRDGALVEILIDPESVVACSTIRDQQQKEERLIAQA